MNNLLKDTFNKILDLLLPQKCIGCGISGELFCEECLYGAKKCEKYLGDDTFAVFSYKDKNIKKAISLIKYKGVKYMTPPLAKYIYDLALEEISQIKMMSGNNIDEKIIVIPVPLHKSRLKTRGFNQSELIARQFLKLDTGNSFFLDTESLERVKETESQVKTDGREKRLVNLKDAFCVPYPENVKNKIILLVDDVITTGATIDECRKTLKNAGARKVFAVAIAH
ncbi:MAG: ComF family protein [bacterium]